MGLEVKEGIVLDREGRPLYEPAEASSQHHRAGPQVRVIRGGWPLVAMLAIGIPLFLVAGLVIVAVVAAIFILIWLVRGIFGRR